MYLILLSLWIFVGLGAGWFAGKRLAGEGYGVSMNISMGIAGALIGGILMRSIGFSDFGGTVLTSLVAVTCAALFTRQAAMSNGQKIYVRAI